MKECFATEGVRRKEDYKNLEEKMSARLEEVLKNEENARRLVQNELTVMKGAVPSAARLAQEWDWDLVLSSRWKEMFVPRKMEFKGWVADYTHTVRYRHW